MTLTVTSNRHMAQSKLQHIAKFPHGIEFVRIYAFTSYLVLKHTLEPFYALEPQEMIITLSCYPTKPLKLISHVFGKGKKEKKIAFLLLFYFVYFLKF